MRMFDVYYSGVITIEAETEEDARIEFFDKYFDYGDIDEIEDVTEAYNEEWEE